jgi:hypothetical protein
MACLCCSFVCVFKQLYVLFVVWYSSSTTLFKWIFYLKVLDMIYRFIVMNQLSEASCTGYLEFRVIYATQTSEAPWQKTVHFQFLGAWEYFDLHWKRGFSCVGIGRLMKSSQYNTSTLVNWETLKIFIRGRDRFIGVVFYY